MSTRSTVSFAPEFDFSGLDVTQLHDPTPNEIGQLGAELLQNKYRELLATLDSNELASRLLAWIRVNAPLDTPLSLKDQLAWSEYAVLELLERGVITQIVQTPESDADLQKLRAAVAKSGLRPAPVAPTAAAVPQVVAQDPIADLKHDYAHLSSGEFKAKWMRGERLAIFERACASGRM